MNPYYDSSDLIAQEQCMGCHSFFNQVFMKFIEQHTYKSKKSAELMFKVEEPGFYCSTCDPSSMSIL
ncbi:hypothetical protein LCGC14_0405670 [marine sediment metagenome]|uniref:Uncharacterized protein n=1 Tax=marine sediment metagenome TaxID=412755 RepID=A0A0F9W4N8_9ZZZZ|nr:hypothetical protein [archaeon]